MNKKTVVFLALCLVSTAIVIMAPSTGADQIATNIKTHHREGIGTYTYPADDFFRDEYDSDTVPDGYDNVYYSFYATDGGSPYVGFLLVEILDPTSSPVYTYGLNLDAGDSGVFSSWLDFEYWEVPSSPVLGTYTLNIWNATEIIGSHTFEVYDPASWTATVELYEDFGHTITSDLFPMGSQVYYTVHIEDEHGGPLYYQYNFNYAYSYGVLNDVEVYLDFLILDYEGYDQDSFLLSTFNFEPGDWEVQIQYPSGTDIPNTTPFTVYDPVYTATIKTWTEGFDTETSTYPMNDYIYWTAHIEDQHGRNLETGTSIYLQIDHGETNWWRFWGGSVDSEGNGSGSRDLQFSLWDDEEQIGLYTIYVSDGTWNDPFEGSAEFEVIGLQISPEKGMYAQEEELTFTITSKIYQSNINVTIYDEDWNIVQKWSGQSMGNKVWTNSYTLPSTLPDGLYRLSVNESESGRRLGILEFNVKKYTLEIQPNSGAYLPGETMTVFYTVKSNRDGSGVSGTRIEWILEYYDTEDDEWEEIYGDPIPNAGSSGSFDISIPRVASKTTDAVLHVWANDTNEHFFYSPRSIGLGTVFINSLYTNANEYLAGDFVILTIDASVREDGFNYPLRNGNVYLNISKDGIVIATYTVDGLRTDMQGDLTYIFPLQSSATTGEYVISVNVSKENEWDTDTDEFEVVTTRALTIELAFDNKPFSNWNYPVYYTGDTVTVTYDVWRGSELIENVNCEYWVGFGNTFIDAGITTSDQFSFTIPSDFDGTLMVALEVMDSDGKKATKTAYVTVIRAGLLFEPNTNMYEAGDTIRVDYEVVGADIPGAGYSYEIRDDHGTILVREDLAESSGRIIFNVPEGNVPDSYTLSGYITDSNGVIVASNSETFSKKRGFMLTFTLDKKTYKPGDTATLEYEITSMDGSDLPDKFTLNYGFYGGEQRSIETDKAKGSVKVTVPEEAADGTGEFRMSSPDLEASSAQQQANIRENPNPLAEAVAGDLTLLDLILLILVIITLLIALVGWRRGGKAMEEAKLPPWKKDRPLPEPDQFKEPSEEPAPPEDEMSPGPVEEPPGPGDVTPPGPPQEPGIPPDEGVPPPPQDTPPPY